MVSAARASLVQSGKKHSLDGFHKMRKKNSYHVPTMYHMRLIVCKHLSQNERCAELHSLNCTIIYALQGN